VRGLKARLVRGTYEDNDDDDDDDDDGEAEAEV
jgi:hypothetical protein